MIKKTNDFNNKYLVKVIEGKRGPNVITSLIDRFKSRKTPTQIYYQNKYMSKNVFHLLDYNAEMKPSDRKNFEIEYEKLKKESDIMRYEYHKEMDLILSGLEECMDINMS